MFDDEFFANCQVINNNANHKKIKFADIMNENNIRQVHDIFTRTGFVLNLRPEGPAPDSIQVVNTEPQ